VEAEPGDLEALLTADERELFARGYISFMVDQPVTVYVFRDKRLEEDREPFWLYEDGFERTDFRAEAYQQEFDVWRKDIPAGEVALGSTPSAWCASTTSSGSPRRARSARWRSRRSSPATLRPPSWSRAR
jgi:hypothetical protein